MRSNYKPKNKKTQILYDARGVRIPDRRASNGIKKFLLFGLLPYIVINGVIFIAVTARPKIAVQVAATNDYRTTEVAFTVKSLLPLKTLTATIEAKEIPFEKNGSTYTATVDMNGTLYVDAVALNGMHTAQDADISVLDDKKPTINEESCDISGGNLKFTIADSQSGVNFDSIYGIYDGNKEVRPSSYDRETGVVVMPFYTNELQVHAEDMVGNAMSVNISASTDYDGTKGETGDAEISGDEEVELDGDDGTVME